MAPLMIGIMGAKKAGKDTIATMLSEMAPAKIHHAAFATALKKMAYDLNPVLPITEYELVSGPRIPRHAIGTAWNQHLAFISCKELVDLWGWDEVKNTAAGRHYLQDLGMVLRDVDKDFWVTALHATLWSDNGVTDCQTVVITDVRFTNEIDYVRDFGEVWRVNRDAVEDGDPHPSEREWRDTKADRIFDNNGTISGLYDQVETAWMAAGGLVDVSSTHGYAISPPPP